MILRTAVVIALLATVDVAGAVQLPGPLPAPGPAPAPDLDVLKLIQVTPPPGAPLPPPGQPPIPGPVGQQPPAPAPTPGAKPTPQPPAPGPTVGRTRGRDVNLQIEITITDQLGTETPEKKVVSMIVADSTMGRIRASADASREGMGFVGTGLNVDARPAVLESDRIMNPRVSSVQGDRILLELTVEYTPFRESSQVKQRPTLLNESLSVILYNGKSMVISQAADPVSDRKITLEVKASIMK